MVATDNKFQVLEGRQSERVEKEHQQEGVHTKDGDKDKQQEETEDRNLEPRKETHNKSTKKWVQEISWGDTVDAGDEDTTKENSDWE